MDTRILPFVCVVTRLDSFANMNNVDDDSFVVIVSFTQESVVSASAWMKGISLSVLASIIGGASKLAIRKSWLIEQQQEQNQRQPLTATTESTNDVVVTSLSINDGDTHAQYSQITSSVDGDTHHVLNSFSDNIPDDHYGRHNHIESSPNRYIPIALRTFGMIGMTALNPLCSVLAMNYASPSILAPFSGLTLVWIVLFSEVLVGEQPTVRQVIAAALIVMGEVVIAIFGDHTNDENISVDEVVRNNPKSLFLRRLHSNLLSLNALSDTGSFVLRDQFYMFHRRNVSMDDFSFVLHVYVRKGEHLSHLPKVCMGCRWRINHWLSKLFERFINNFKSVQDQQRGRKYQ